MPGDPRVQRMLEGILESGRAPMLDKLPPNERQECRALWGDIDDLIKRSQALKPPGQS